MQRLLFNEGQDVVDPSARLTPVVSAVGVTRPAESPAAAWKSLGGTFVAQASEGKLLEVVGTLESPRRLAGRLHRRQQQRDKNADDCYHDQQLDQRKTV